jgi:hypothetical protein
LNLAFESTKETAKKLAKGSDSLVEFDEFRQKVGFDELTLMENYKKYFSLNTI